MSSIKLPKKRTPHHEREDQDGWIERGLNYRNILNMLNILKQQRTTFLEELSENVSKKGEWQMAQALQELAETGTKHALIPAASPSVPWLPDITTTVLRD